MLVAILILAGLGMIALGLWMLRKARRQKALCTAKATAELLRYEEEETTSSEDGPTTYYYPVFRYIVGGEEHTACSSAATNRRKWKIGARVDILYNPEDPGMIRAPGEFGSYFGFAVAAVLGMACMAFGVLAAAGVLEVNL